MCKHSSVICFSVTSLQPPLNTAASSCSAEREESDVLVREALNSPEQIYGSTNEPLKTDDGKLAEEEATNLASCCSGSPQTAVQCRKDLMTWGGEPGMSRRNKSQEQFGDGAPPASRPEAGSSLKLGFLIRNDTSSNTNWRGAARNENKCGTVLLSCSQHSGGQHVDFVLEN